MQVFTKNTAKNQSIEIQVKELNGKNVGKAFSVQAGDSNYLKNNFPEELSVNPHTINVLSSFTITSLKTALGLK